MQDYRININYAKALFLLAGETQQEESVAADMRLVHEVCAENRELNVVFNNPVIKEDKKTAIVTDLFGERVSRLSMLFLTFVVRKNRTVNLRGISAAYLDLFRQSRNIVLSQLTTAAAADEEVADLVRKVIGDYTRKEVELEQKTNPDIMGGFSLEFDNNMYDATLRSRLQKLRMAFEGNIYESKL